MEAGTYPASVCPSSDNVTCQCGDGRVRDIIPACFQQGLFISSKPAQYHVRVFQRRGFVVEQAPLSIANPSCFAADRCVLSVLHRCSFSLRRQ
jgi:hypothetical protein